MPAQKLCAAASADSERLSPKAPMIFGHNTDVNLHGTVYHVQTEDRGVNNALLETTIYCRGRVLHRLVNNYFDLLPLDSDREAALKLRLDAQHRLVLEEIRTGVLVLAPPPVPGPEAVPPQLAAIPLHLELTNSRTWLKGRQAELLILVKNSAGAPVSGATATARVEGAATPVNKAVLSGKDGLAHLTFDMPALTSTEPAVVIDAVHGSARGRLRFQLRAKPRIPAS